MIMPYSHKDNFEMNNKLNNKIRACGHPVSQNATTNLCLLEIFI